MASTSQVSETAASPRHSWSRFVSPQALILSFVLLVATFAVYYPVQNYPFVDIDDNFYVTQNTHVLGPLNLSTVKWAFTHTIGLNYSPLTLLSHNIDVQMFDLDAGRHHEVNLLFHIFDALLLFWVLQQATGFTWRSFMVAALFALHPIQVENVAWISERKTMLSTVFFFLAMAAYRWYAKQPRLRRMLVVALLYGMGALAKPQVITLPFILLLWDYWPLRRMFAGAPDASPALEADAIPPRRFAQLITEKWPLYVVCVLDVIVTMIAQHAGGPQAYTFAIRLGNAILSYARYLGMMFWPPNLALMYLHPGNSLPWGQVGLAFLLLAAICAFVIAKRQYRYLVVGWLWYIGAMVPMIGLVQVDFQALADRYAYVSFIGLFLMICWGAADFAKQRHLPRLFLPATSVAILLVLSVMTHRQVGFWRDRITLWTHTLDVTHPNFVADIRLGTAYREQGNRQLAMDYYTHAAEDRPGDSWLYLNIGILHDELGDPRQAILFYEKALAFSEHGLADVQILQNMAHAYGELGDYARARELAQAAAAVPRPVAQRSAINWQGEWWRDLAPMMWARVRGWMSGHSDSPPAK